MQTGDSYPQTLPALFSRALQRYADRTALVANGQSFTFRDLQERSDRLAAALVGSGVEPEDRVAVYMDNRPALVVADLAIARAGATRLPVDPMLSQSELAYVLSDARAETIVCGPDQVADVAAIEGEVSSLARKFVAGPDDLADDLPEGFRAIEDAIADAPGEVLRIGVEPDDVAGHYYTGGTTGRPKGVVYTHRSLVACLRAHLAEFAIGGDDVGLLVPPLSHSAGTFCWTSLLAGGRLVLQDGFDPEHLLAAVEHHGVTWTFVVPTMLYRLLDHPGLDDADLSTLERVLYGAAPMRSDRLREAIERLGSIFVQFYGQTEVPNLITTFGRQEHARAAEMGDDERLTSAGQPCLSSSIRIVDPETGGDVPVGERGEVVATAPYAFDGYFERPEETAATLRDGWVHTGDVGRLDEDGYLYLLDRMDDVIVTGGLNVHCREVEGVVGRHPAVENVVVVGVPDDDWGEAVHAVVVADPNAGLTAEGVREFVAAELADYKKPKSVAIVDALPKTSLGKLDRSAVRDRFWADETRDVG